MTLAQALQLLKNQKDVARTRRLFLACGFEPLHLVTMLRARFAERFPREAAEIETGLYGNVEQALAAAHDSDAEAAIAVIEWSDVDPRMGLRSAGGWGPSVQPEILANSEERWTGIVKQVKRVAATKPVVVVPPTLPLLPLGHTAGWQASRFELELQRQLAEFLAKTAEIGGVSILNSRRINSASPQESRLDALMELKAGFPYTVAHASAVASECTRLLFPPAPMKALITDLDDTLWDGILGDVGVRGVSWSLEEHSQIHSLYQQMLRSLSESGVLLGIASKNEQSLVEEALRRDDLLVPAKAFFPVHANWGAKSKSVGEILRVWNIGPDSVVYVDDSLMELEEVGNAFPAIRCLQFSKSHPAKVIALLEELRDLFGKPTINSDDLLRLDSIRGNAAIQAAATAAESTNGDFVRNLSGTITFDYQKDPDNKRLLELINKTNQFNLNGIRLSDGEWLQRLKDASCVVVGISYEDKFGSLGTIGVLSGRRLGDRFEVTNWVLSCRAFSRQIEDHILDSVFQQPGVAAVDLGFRTTDRNQPLRRYLASLGLDTERVTAITISRKQFYDHIEDLPHQVRLREPQ